MKRCWPIVLLLATLLSAPRSAAADAGEWAMGGVADWQVLRTGRLGIGVERGINDFLALRGEAQMAYPSPGWTGLASIGLTAMLDVLSWVPAVSLQGGLEVGAGGVQARGLARLELRHFVGPQLWIGGGVGVERNPSVWRLLVGLSVFAAF